MIDKGMVEWISQELRIRNRELIEKDLYLHGLLLGLEKSKYFSDNFAFKGGTCLTKAYFGYYRFSVDLDFTWIKQKAFENKSAKQIRKMLSKEINQLMELFEFAAEELELDFKPVKSDNYYVELGGSNRFATFKFWYTPANKQVTFIKIQVNFVDKLFHKPKKRGIKAIAEKHSQELRFLYPKHAKLATQNLSIYTYNLKEIAAEKVRALLTRRGFKARDIIDLYILSREGISIKSVKKMAVEKTLFMLKYVKYAENLKNRNFEESLLAGEEQKLLLQEPGKGFEKFAKKTLKELNQLAQEIQGAIA